MLEQLQAFDSIRLNFSPASLFALNLTLAFVMFGVALEIKVEHFKKLLYSPKSAIIEFISQFVLLPFVTFLLVISLSKYITPTIALGMILVAACPGGNISNFISSLSKGNVALSESLTAIATMGAIIFTPLNFAIWGKLAINFFNAHNSAALVRPIQIDAVQMFQTVFIILYIPFILYGWYNIA